LVFPSERGRSCPATIFCDGTFTTKREKIGLGWVNVQVLRRTPASVGHKEGLDPKVAAHQRGHGIGVAIDVYTKAALSRRAEAAEQLEKGLLTA
jgi:hypothetical protein